MTKKHAWRPTKVLLSITCLNSPCWRNRKRLWQRRAQQQDDCMTISSRSRRNSVSILYVILILVRYFGSILSLCKYGNWPQYAQSDDLLVSELLFSFLWHTCLLTCVCTFGILVCLPDNSADGQMTVDTALVMLQTESSKAEDLAEASAELDMHFYMSSSGSFLLFQHVSLCIQSHNISIDYRKLLEICLLYSLDVYLILRI